MVSLEEFGHLKEKVPHGFREHVANDPSAGDPKHIDTIAATRYIPQLAFWTEEGGMDDVSTSSLNLLSRGASSFSEAHHDIAHDLDTQEVFLDTSKKVMKKVTIMEDEMGYLRDDLSFVTKSFETMVKHLGAQGVKGFSDFELEPKQDGAEWYAQRQRERMQKDVDEMMEKQKAAKKKAGKTKAQAARPAAQQQDAEPAASGAAAAATAASTINLNADEV